MSKNKILKLIKDLRQEGYKKWDEGIYNNDIELKAEGKALLNLSNKIVNNNNIELNNYCDQYGKMYLKKINKNNNQIKEGIK